MQEKRRRKVFCIMILICCYFVCAYSVFASTQSIVTSVINQVEMGIVDISLDEYTLDEEGREVEWKDKTDVVPGDKISKIVRIKNKAMECWVRAKVKIESKIQTEMPISIEQLRGISKEWISIGDYFYYTKTLPTHESIDLFQEVEVPSQWSKENENNEIKIVIQADAVQAKHFTPDFSSDTPWSGLVVEKCIHEDGYDKNIFRVEKESTLLVQYEGEAKKLLAVPDDFFAGFGTLMLGDRLGEVVEIGNKGEKTLSLFFKTEKLEEADLLEKIQLTIKNKVDGEEERIVYEGNLCSKELEQYCLLGCYKPNDRGEFTFTIQVPEELNNAYTLEKRRVKWYFMAEEAKDSDDPILTTKNSTTQTTSVTPSTSSVSRSSTSTSTQGMKQSSTVSAVSTTAKESYTVNTFSTQSQNPYKNAGESGGQSTKPKTGDDTPLIFLLGCAVASTVGILLTTKKLKDNR